jgi:hypothetical protein
MSHARSLATALVAFLLCVPHAFAQQDLQADITIPLKEIWAYDMPGTRHIRELEPQAFERPKRAGPLVRAIHAFLNQVSPSEFRPGPGFAVQGTGIEALRRAKAVLADKEKPVQVLSAADDVTLVFFARSGGVYLHIDEVKRDGTSVSIKYHFVAHLTTDRTTHFALIPMGKLTPGKYHVSLVQLPPTTEPPSSKLIDKPKPPDAEWVSRIVCSPFKFDVK